MRDDLHADEERELEQRYGLTEAVVAGHGIDVGAAGRPAAYASVGRAAAALLMRRLSPNDVLGFTWAPNKSRWPTPSRPASRAAAQWSNSTARCRPPRIRPAPSSSSAAARMCCAPPRSGCPRPLYAGPVDRGVDAQRLTDLPHARGRQARRHDAVRRGRCVDVDHAVRGQLP